MNLTIEQMREIVDGAPIGATDYSDEDPQNDMMERLLRARKGM